MTINNSNFCDGDQKNSPELEISRWLFYVKKNKAPLLGALWRYKSAVKNKRVY